MGTRFLAQPTGNVKVKCVQKKDEETTYYLSSIENR